MSLKYRNSLAVTKSKRFVEREVEGKPVSVHTLALDASVGMQAVTDLTYIFLFYCKASISAGKVCVKTEENHSAV